jgi:hypothetical protein
MRPPAVTQGIPDALDNERALVPQLSGADTHKKPTLGGQELQPLDVLGVVVRVGPVLFAVVLGANHEFGPPHIDAA